MFKKALGLLSVLFLLSCVLTVSFFNVFDDPLFFHSDPASILRFVTCISAVLALLFFLLAIPFINSNRAVSTISVICGSVLAAAFLFFVIDALGRQFGVWPALRKRNVEILVVFLWPLVCLAVGYKLLKTESTSAYVSRVNRIALFLFPLLIVLTLISRPLNIRESQPQRVVLLVLDAMPSQYLNTFHTDIPPLELDTLFKEALVFRNMRTQTPWTNGYFGSMYSGTPEYALERWTPPLHRWKRALLSPRWNLFKALQAKGVKTRWIVEHNAAIPETARVYGYRGLRSFLLGQRFSHALDWINVDYNLLVSLPGVRSFKTQRRLPVYELLNKPASFRNTLSELYVPYIEKFHTQSDKTFLVLHVRWPFIREPIIPDIQDSQGNPTQKAIIQSGFKYAPEHEWYAKQLARDFRDGMVDAQKKISEFLKECGKRNLLEDTLFILTADHGQIADRGRLWYVHHPEEEVLRVPMAIFYRGKKGVDDRNMQTENLVETIVDFFGAKPLDERKRLSLFEPGENEFTASITLPSHATREAFVILWRSNEKYVFNIHPESSGEAQKFRVAPGSFQTELLFKGNAVYVEAKPYLRKAIRNFGLTESQVHILYKDLFK